MKNLSIIKTRSGNSYLITPSKFHIWLSPVIEKYINHNLKSDHNPSQKLEIEGYLHNIKGTRYYYDKYLFLLKHGLLAERDCPNKEKLSGRINEQIIKWQLSNLTQLVFEVTDSCNLKCKYCAYGGKIGHIDHPRSFSLDHAFPAAKDHPKLTSFFASILP